MTPLVPPTQDGRDSSPNIPLFHIGFAVSLVLIFISILYTSPYQYTNDFIFHYALSSGDHSNPDLYPRYTEESFDNYPMLAAIISMPSAQNFTLFGWFWGLFILLIPLFFYIYFRNPYAFLFYLAVPFAYNIYYASLYAQLLATTFGAVAVMRYVKLGRMDWVSFMLLFFIWFTHNSGIMFSLTIFFSLVVFDHLPKIRSFFPKQLAAPAAVVSLQQVGGITSLGLAQILRLYVPSLLVMVRQVDAFLVVAAFCFLGSFLDYRIGLTAGAFLALSLATTYSSELSFPRHAKFLIGFAVFTQLVL